MPSCDAVTMHVPAPVTVIWELPIELEHAPDAAYKTGLPERPPEALRLNGASVKVSAAGSAKPMMV